MAPTAGRQGRRLADQAPESIAAVMGDLSRELHDDHPRSSLGRAVRLWQDSGQSESAFVATLYAAKKETTKRGGIQKRAAGQAGEFGLRNKTPYFLAVLADLLGLAAGALRAQQ